MCYNIAQLHSTIDNILTSERRYGMDVFCILKIKVYPKQVVSHTPG